MGLVKWIVNVNLSLWSHRRLLKHSINTLTELVEFCNRGLPVYLLLLGSLIVPVARLQPVLSQALQCHVDDRSIQGEDASSFLILLCRYWYRGARMGILAGVS